MNYENTYPVERIGITLPLPLNLPWYNYFMEMLKRYGAGCDVYIGLAGIFEDIVNPNGEYSDNLSYMLDQIYCSVLSQLEALGLTEAEQTVALEKISHEIDDAIYSFKLYYAPYFSNIDLGDLNESGFITTYLRGIYQTFIVIELEGAKYAIYPIPNIPVTT